MKTVLEYANTGKDLLVSPPSTENSLLNSGGSLKTTQPTLLYRIKDTDAKIFTFKITVKNVNSFTVGVWSGETVKGSQTRVRTSIIHIRMLNPFADRSKRKYCG